MQTSRSFSVVGAVACFAAAVLVLVAQLGLNGYGAADSPAALAALYLDATYQTQSLAILVQVILMFTGLYVLALRFFQDDPSVILLALAALFFWQVLEIVPRSIDYFAFADMARAALDENDAAVRAEKLAGLSSASAMLDGIPPLRRLFWALVHALFAIVLLRGAGPARLLGLIFAVNAIRLFLGALIGTLLPNIPFFWDVNYWLFVVLMVLEFAGVGWFLLGREGRPMQTGVSA